MLRLVGTFSVMAAIMAGGAASAAQLTNIDTVEQKLTISENNASRELTVKPSETIGDICNAGCTMKMPNGQEYDFSGSETISIEKGLLFLDEPARGFAVPPKS